MNADIFATTCWTQVIAAQGDSTHAGAALAELCAAYYAPVHAYMDRTARDLGDPRDLTQEFFARLLAGKSLTGAAREKGRFRGYLLGAAKHFLADTRARKHAAKRGAQHEHVPLAVGTDTSPGIDPPAENQVPDAWFDRQWGFAVLERAVGLLAAEQEREGRAEQFRILKPWLTGDSGDETQAQAAQRLGINEGAVKVAIHRLRKRFREVLRAEIGETVSSDEEARAELRYLIEVVG